MPLRLRRLIIVFFVLLTLGVLSVFIAFKFFAAPWLKNKLEAELSSVLKAKVQIKSLEIQSHFPSLMPLVLLFRETIISRPNEYAVQVEQIKAEVNMPLKNLNLKALRPQVKVEIDKPEIQFEISESPKTPPTPSKKSPPETFRTLRELSHAPAQLADLNLNLRIKNLSIDIKKLHQSIFKLEQTNLFFEMKSFLKPVDLKIESLTNIKNPLLPFWIPWGLETQLNVSDSKLQILQANIKLLGLNSKSQGTYDLSNEIFQIDSELTAEDLSKIPLTVKDLPVKSWTGGLQAKVKAQGPKSNPRIEGSLKLTQAKLQLDYQAAISSMEGAAQTSVKAKGEIAASLDLNFFWERSLKISKLWWDLNASPLELSYGDVFHKPHGVDFKTRGQLNWDTELKIEDFRFQFASLEALASGVYRAGANSNMLLQIQPTDLKGFEKFFQPLAQYPLTGQLGLKANLSGPLDGLDKLGKKDLIRVEIANLKLENFSTAINYQNKDLQLSGPLLANINGSLSLKGSEVLSGQFDLSGDFSKLKIKYQDLFLKETGDLAKIKLRAQKKGPRLQLQSSQIQFPGGSVDISGEPPLGLEDPLHFVFETTGVDSQALLKWFPKYEKLIPKLNLKTRLDLSGRVNAQNFMQSPLQTRGNVAIRLPQLILPKIESQKPAPPPSENKTPKSMALLPDSVFLKGLNLKITAEISDFSMLPYKAQGIQAQMNIANDQLSATGNIQNVFGGSLVLSQLTVPLFIPEPGLKFAVSSTGLRIEQMLEAILPPFAKLMKAQSQVEIAGQSPWPTSPQFLEQLKARGQLKLSNGLLSTVELTNMFKDLIAKIPQAKPEMLTSRGPLQISQGLVNFKMDSGKIQLNPLNVISARHEEINLAGELDLKLNVNLSGQLALVDNVKSLGSFFEANKDSKDRLIVPLTMTGNALKPELSMAQDSLNKMLAKTFEYEKNKVVESAKKQVSTELELKKKEIEKSVGDEVKKRLEGLFH